MTWFEVFIPAKEAGMPSVTLTVEAPNWIGALRTGLSNLGEGHDAIANVMCDIKEDSSIHVTDVTGGRVFRLREVSAPAARKAAPAPVTIPTPMPPPASVSLGVPSTSALAPDAETVPEIAMPQPPPAALAPTPLPPPMAATRPMPPPRQATMASPEPLSEAPTRPMPPPPPRESTAVPPLPNVAAATERARSGPVPAPTPRGVPAPLPRRPTGQFEAAPQPVSREVSTAPQPSSAAIGRHDNTVPPQAIADAVADVFDATQDLLIEGSTSPEKIGERLLDIALQYIPAESASFYVADVNHDELRFAAVRGPKAADIKKSGLAVKVGEGIVGFCAREGVCLSVSDIQKDPRWFSNVAAAVGHSPRDTVCASAEKDGRLYGAVQVLNSKQGFTAVHMEVLRYIGLTAAALLERHEQAR